MPRILKFFKEKNLKSKMLIQVHDELIFEVPNNEIEIIKEFVPKIMTNSHDNFLNFKVPIKVDLGLGQNWNEAN